MRRLLPILILLCAVRAFAAGGTCPSPASYRNPADPYGPLVTLAAENISSCYYFSKSAGLDSNNGTSESTPQQHLPCMPDYTGSISPTAGEGFILKGGDTWTSSDLDCYITQTDGTLSHPYYYGVDFSWPPSGWTRPVFDCGGGPCTYTLNGDGQFTVNGAYVYVDQIEQKGMLFPTSGSTPLYYQSYNQSDVLMRGYIHGWAHGSGTSNDTGVAASFGNNAGHPSTNSGVIEQAIDGCSDTTMDMLQAISGAPNFILKSVLQCVTNEFQNETSVVGDTYFGPLVASYAAGQHQNMLQIATVDNGETYQLVWNSVLTGSIFSGAGGAVKVWLNQDAVPAGTVGYMFNMAIYNNLPGNFIDLGGHTAVFNGTWNLFNSTLECGTDSSPGSGAGGCGNDGGGTAGMTFTFKHGNNHIITNASPPFTCTFGTCSTILGADIVQSVATASGQGYISGSTYAFQPTSGSGATVAGGSNAQSVCTAINAIGNVYATAAYNACLYDTGYSCTYNISSHTISCPQRTQLLRPASTAWDIGAYQFSGGAGPSSVLSGIVLTGIY